MEPIILASASPRRQEYFRILGLPFTCITPHVKETVNPAVEPEAAAEELAVRKVKKILEIQAGDPPRWVCGADTLISFEGKIFGKAAAREDARAMLRDFRGKTHNVITAIALYNGRTQKTSRVSVTSSVTFAPLSEAEIAWYLDTDEWRGAAGSYKIQGLASCFISNIKGSYSSIVGLPLREFYVMLKDNNYPFGG